MLAPTPMPLLPPVITAVFPAKFKSMVCVSSEMFIVLLELDQGYWQDPVKIDYSIDSRNNQRGDLSLVDLFCNFSSINLQLVNEY